MWDALLSCLHVIDGIDAPLTVDALNTLTARAIAAGLAGARGQSSLGQLVQAAADWYNVKPLAFLDYQYPRYEYSHPDRHITGWLNVLQEHAGINPIVLMFEHVSAGLPDNEAGVNRHGIAVLGADPVTVQYQCANGDSSVARAGKLSIYSLSMLERAGVCGLIVFPRSIRPASPPPAPDWHTTALDALATVETLIKQHQAA